MKRKSFQNLPGEENPQFLIDGTEIYELMRKKYPQNTIEGLDNVLNGICTSLIILTETHVAKDNHKNFLQLIYKILDKNIDEPKL